MGFQFNYNRFSILFILVVIFGQSQGMRKNFGEFCNSTIKCATSSWLRCSADGTCECSRPEHMIYNFKIGQCVARAGERCKYRLDKGPASNFNEGVRPGAPGGPILFEEIVCVENAQCSGDGSCICQFGFYESPINGTCQPLKGINEPCQSNFECSTYDSLKCIEGVCTCDPNNSILYKEECVGLPGSNCINYRCGENSKCSSPNPYINYKFAFGNNGNRLAPARPVTIPQGKCICSSGFTLKNGKCYANYRHFCNSESRCDPDKFVCIDGLCHCKSPLHQIYNEKLGYCQSLVGGSCKIEEPQTSSELGDFTMEEMNYTIRFDLSADNSTSTRPQMMPCIQGADCVKSFGEEGICECREGMVENSEGMCNLAFGEPCPVIQSLQEHPEHLFCDKLAPLNCMEGHCSCPDTLSSVVYDSLRRKCVGKLGSRCRKSSKYECIEGAECIHKHEKLMGRCECSRGYHASVNNNRTCIPRLVGVKESKMMVESGEKIEEITQKSQEDDNNLEFVEEGSGAMEESPSEN